MRKRVRNIGVLIIVVGVLFAVYSYVNISKQDTKSTYINVNTLIEANWTNIGSWILISPVNPDEYDMGFDGEISFDKDMFEGKEKAIVVDQFIKMINDRCDKNIKVINYKRDEQTFELNYEDGARIIWDFEAKKGILKKSRLINY